MYKTFILPTTKADIKDAALWYNQQQSGLGKRFTKEVRAKVVDIKTNPLAYSVRYDDVRTAVVDVFPFMIHFIIENKNIIVTAVLNTSLNPDKWADR
ncbi:MAG TPA: type II toxin-antitoxin system RelE/ParE family toxin [Edaphocola sp.]|nr:type II toxin-antitoxin system RelE/ParE family toxin [Edaphocola sp.]